MAKQDGYSTIIGKLRTAVAHLKPGQELYDNIVAERDQVFATYRPIFSSDHIPTLSKEEFTSFLYLENNHHWSGLYRWGLGAAQDMEKLREAVGLLLDEGKPIRERFTESLKRVKGLGKGIATGILTVAYPEKYGVWNNTSEAALRQEGLWPTFERGEGKGAQYEEVNNLLLRLSSDLGIDLWTLDALWWFLLKDAPAPEGGRRDNVAQLAESLPEGESFVLERQLQVFLLENRERTALAKEWKIYATEDEPEAGNQFPTDIGRIDILAMHKTEAKFLVVELKRNQSSDDTIGQIMRYVGWVKQHLATDGQSVEALIIAHTAEKNLQYALSALPNVRMLTYEMEFRLKALQPLHT